MSHTLQVRLTRSCLTISNCPQELFERFSYAHHDINWTEGNFVSKTFLIPYANIEGSTCRTYPNALHIVQNWAAEQGWELTLDDCRSRPILELATLDKALFRTTCFQALERVVAAQDSGLIIGPTGMGKTSIILGLIALLPKDPDFKILVSTEEKNVVGQIYRQLREAFPADSIGIVNKPQVEAGRIMVVNQDSFKDLAQGELAAMGCGLKDYGAWICDEVHRLPVKSRIAFINQMKPAFSWGLTATPKRSDNAHELNGAYFGRVLYEVSHKEVLTIQKSVKESGIVPIKVTVFPLPTEQAIPESLSLHMKTKLAYRRNSKLGLLIRGIDALIPEDQKVLLFADTIPLSLALKKAMPHYHLVNGKIHAEQRQAMLDKFKRGSMLRVISTDVWSEGVDVPDLGYVIDCSYKLSPNLITQRAGRAARSSGEKTHGNYLMLLCLGSEHLFNHGVAKLQHFNRLGWEVHFAFPKELVQTMHFQQAPLLVELGAFSASLVPEQLAA